MRWGRALGEPTGKPTPPLARHPSKEGMGKGRGAAPPSTSSGQASKEGMGRGRYAAPLPRGDGGSWLFVN